MIRFFKSPQPAALIIIPFIIIVLWIYHGWNAVPVSDPLSLPLWNVIAGLFSGLPAWLNFIFLWALISFTAVYFNLMLNKHEVLYKNSYLPSLIFALLISSTPGLFLFHPIHFVNLLILIIFNRMFTMFKNDKANAALFDSAFLSGVASLIYFPALLLFIVLIIALRILRPFNLKEWLIVMIGFILPYFFVSVYMFWNHSLIPFWSQYISLFSFSAPTVSIVQSNQMIYLGIVVGLLLLFSLLKLRANHSKNVIRTRSFQQLFFILFFLGTISIAITHEIKIIHLAILALPTALFIAYLYLSAKRRIRLFEFSLWILIAVIVWNQLI
jgi:hypothetical protein